MTWRDQPAAVHIFIGAMITLFVVALLGFKFGHWDYPDAAPPIHQGNE